MRSLRAPTSADPVMAEIHLEIPPRLDYLAVVRLVVATAAALVPPLPESRLDDLRLFAGLTEAARSYRGARVVQAQPPGSASS